MGNFTYGKQAPSLSLSYVFTLYFTLVFSFTSKIKANKQIPMEYLMQMMPKKKLYFHFSNFLTKNSNLSPFFARQPFTTYSSSCLSTESRSKRSRKKFSFDVLLILPLRKTETSNQVPTLSK